MAISVFKTFAVGEILTAADLNSSFTQITGNGEDLAWPATKAKDLNGQELILDADGDTSITSDTDDQIDFKVAGADDFRITPNTLTALAGSTVDGTPGTINVTDARFSIKDDADDTKIAQFQCSNITTATTRTITIPDADIAYITIGS